MAGSAFLRKNKNQHSIKNSLSKGMEVDIDAALKEVIETLSKRHPKIKFRHFKKLDLSTIVARLGQDFPQYKQDFSSVLNESFMRPDGGFLYAISGQGEVKPVLVAEVKRQGTNDKRELEGLPKQAKGNAIERLGKNLIGIRAIFKQESVIPFVCFGSGHDFSPGSTILDRVVTMNEFFPLNTLFVKKDHPPFEPVSMYFRYKDWTTAEMVEIMLEIAETAIRSYSF